MKPLLEIVVPLLVIFVMTVVGMDLRYEDFRRVRRYPVLVPSIVVGQWIAVMVVAGLIGRLLELPHAIAGGALLVAAAPVATLSNYYTQLARGHLALAVTVAAVSNALAVFATPLVATAGFRLFLGESAAFELSIVQVAQQTVVVLLLPLLAGMFVRQRAARWTLRWRTGLQALALLAVVAVVAFVVVDQFATIAERIGILLAASVLLTLATTGIGVVVVRSVTSARDELRALLWGFPARNAAVATLIATAVVGQVAMASFVAVLFVTQVAILATVALWLNWLGTRRTSNRGSAGRPS